MKKLLLALVMAGMLGGAVYGAAAAITVTGSNVGAGDGAVAGFAISGVTYGLDGTDPTLISTVSFAITPSAAFVDMKTNAGGDAYANWSCTSGLAITCTASPQPSASAVSQIHVAASS